MSKSSSKRLILYHTFLYRRRQPFLCPKPDCGLSVLPKEYEKHCERHHRLDPNLCCVWCETTRWDSGRKSEQGDHLKACSQRVLKASARPDTVLPSSPTAPNPLLPAPRLLSLRLLCPAQCFFDHVSDTIQRLPRPFDLFSPPSCSWPPLAFRDASLNLAASYVRHYLATRDTRPWFHIMVKAVSYPSFVEAMDEDAGQTRVLAFSCWCDGGKYPQPKHRQHRHLLLVSPPDHFMKQVWPRVTVAPEDRPVPHFPCKGLKRIVSPLHLVNTLGYLSQRKSRCQFKIEARKGARQNKHFYITQSLPSDYKKALATQWEGGVYELLYQEAFQNVSLERVIEHPLVPVGRQWKQKIGDFYKLERRLVLPIEKRFAPTPEPTPYFLHLMHGRKLYFQPDPANARLEDEAWLLTQVRGGHCFYDAIGEELWTPRKRDQASLKIIMRLKLGQEDLRRDLARLREENTRVKADNDQLKAGKAHWKRQWTELAEEHKALTKKQCQLYERETRRLKRENEQLKSVNTRLMALVT